MRRSAVITRSSGNPAEERPLEVAPGIHCLAVSTPFAIGTVNAYLLEGDPLTLIDGGPNLATSLLELERMIRAAGHELDDLELLLITHQHLDHEGLTSTLAERSGADVACLVEVADYVSAYDESQRADDRFAHALMLSHGVDRQMVDALASVAPLVAGLGAPVAVTHRLEHGEVIEAGGHRLRALHRPGHSPSDTVFHDEDAGVLFAGDHLLSKISSNALVSRVAQDGCHARTRPLLDYRRSLRETAQLELDLVLGGHGGAIRDTRTLIEQRLRAQQRKADCLNQLLERRPRAAHELATALYGAAALTQPFLTLSEVLGHLDLLVEEGAVAAETEGGVVTFHTV
jgi:glyoxylase-like metal-dependent hydrolase (beta-lactamase superfamily II)